MRTILLIFFTFFSVAHHAQNETEELYLPLEFRKAYKEGTRAKSGRVAEGYWQNKSKYVIDVTIDTKTRLLAGKANITYFNNSPDTINNVTFHAYPDYLKPYAKRGSFYTEVPEEQADYKGFALKEITLENDTVDINNKDRVSYGGTNYTLMLQEPLLAGDSLELSIEWNYVIPLYYSRSGAMDSTSMFIAYWYPQIAVMDDIDGWDKSIYDTRTEFYHDFSDYDVTITVPDNFTVWASVPPENPKEVYTPAVLEKLEQARRSDTAVPILTRKDFRTKSDSTITWKYKAENFPDFSFALSDHYLWEANAYRDELGEYFLQTAYPAEHKDFTHLLRTLHESLELLHDTFPKYNFPYKYFTMFNGMKQQAMEFPGMMNASYRSKEEAEGFLGKKLTNEEFSRIYIWGAVHEMAHMYLPFMMGINEKKYAWMDEGFASFASEFSPRLLPLSKQDRPELGALNIVPLMITSNEHENSWINSYDISSAAYSSLYELMGREKFLSALHGFMDEWKYKHPTPYDLMFFFNGTTETDLNWFWNNWYFDWGYIDVGIVNVKDDIIRIENEGGKAVSFKILLTFEDGEIYEEEINPAVWKESSSYRYRNKISGKNLSRIELVIPPIGDAVFQNNVWEK